MLRNYFTATLRNLIRNKLYAAINVVGLAVGFAAVMLIALYVRDEFSYDKWLPGYERVLSVTETMQYPARASVTGHRIPAELAEPLKLDFPQIESIARIAGGDISLRHGDIEANEAIFWADPEIFDLLRLPSVSGDLAEALKRPDGLVLTRRMAQKYFGDADPIGATMEINREHQMRVAAVLEDLPSNTHLNTEIFGSGLASFSFLSLRRATPAPSSTWSSTTHTYLRLTPGASVQELEQKLPAFLERHKGEVLKNFEKIDLRLTARGSAHAAG